MTEDELVELLAEAEHASWARWMRYLCSLCAGAEDGSLIIPPDRVRLWRREMDAHYADLSDREQQYDRDEVAHILPIIREYTQSGSALLEGKEPGEGVAFVKGPIPYGEPRPFHDPFEQDYVPQPVQLWQTCPKCNGQKHVTTPPWVAGDIRTFTTAGVIWTFTTAGVIYYPCPVCEGRGLVTIPTVGGGQ